jgi:starvation-inducible DNA-binding protein
MAQNRTTLIINTVINIGIMKNGIGISEENRAQVARSLNVLLADEHILYMKTRDAHWNVTGPDFHVMHLFFEKQYQQLEEIIDELAERIRMLDHYPEATLRHFLELTHLSEGKDGNNSSLSFIKSLLRDHHAVIIHLREAINEYAEKWKDAGSSDFVNGLLEKHEKISWMLRAHLI